MESKVTSISTPVREQLEKVTSSLVPTIDMEMELKSSTLSAMRDALAPLRAKVDDVGFSMAGKVNAAVQTYQKALADNLAALAVNDKGKFEHPESYDGFKSPQQIAVKLYGYSATIATDLVAWGRERRDKNAPDALKDMPLSNYGAVKAADRGALLKAIKDGEITASTPQTALKDFAAKHPGKTKTGKARVVTTFTIYRGGNMEEAPGGAVTEEDFKDNFPEGAKVLKLEDFTLVPEDAPNKKLTGKRYVAVYEDFSAMVFTLIPVYQKAEDKPEHIQKAEEFENGIIARFMQSHPDASREDAISTLRELGML